MQEGQACIARFIVEELRVASPPSCSIPTTGGSVPVPHSLARYIPVICFRKHERVKLGIACKLVLPDGVTEEAEMRDVSMGGARWWRLSP